MYVYSIMLCPELTFDLAVVTLTLESYLCYISKTVRCRRLMHGLGKYNGWSMPGILVGFCSCVTSWHDLGVTFDLGLPECLLLPY